MSPLLPALRRLCLSSVLALVVLGMTASLAIAQDVDDGGDVSDSGATTFVEILPFHGLVDPPVAAQIRDVLEQAEQEGSDLVILQVDSGGGVSAGVEDLVELIQDSPVPVAVHVGPLGTRATAAGAAGLLWLAADIQAVSSDATVGPIAPADFAAGDAEAEQALLRSLLGDRADEELVAELLTSSVDAERLTETGLATLRAEGLEPLLVDLDGVSVSTATGERELELVAGAMEVRFHSLGLVRRLLHAATTAPFIYLLLIVGLGLLLFEVFQPGFGVAGLAGLITAGIGVFGLVVLPVVWWAVALVVLGLILYAIDTAVAGFGPITVAATAAFAVGSLNFYDADALALPWLLVVLTTLTALIFFVFVMTVVLRAQAGPEGVAVDDLVGKVGAVRSVLNPEGHVYIDGALWRARWTGETKRAKVGTPVRVHGVDGPVVLVEPFDPEAVAAGRGSEAGQTSGS
jgi:membrane-bound serine protease (ClpP class)